MSNITIVPRTEADFRCYQCRQTIDISLHSGMRPLGPRRFRRSADGSWSVIQPPMLLRCSVCAGPEFLEAFGPITRIEPPVAARDRPPQPA